MKNVLKNIIENEHSNKYILFKEYCLLKDKGLRKESFKVLDSFINELRKLDLTLQQDFADWLFSIFERSEDIHHVLVYPLEEQILKPLLDEWIDLDPQDIRPYKWYGLFLHSENQINYLNKALELGGNKEQLVIIKLIESYFDSLWFSFHHISEDLYLGSLAADKYLINKLEHLAPMVKDEQYKINLLEGIIYYTNLLNDWINLKEEGCEGFVKWCKNKGKVYQWVEHYYYGLE